MGLRRTGYEWTLVTMLAVLLCAGCKVTSADVDVWKGTVKGPGKMVAVMQADKYDLELRTYAGAALVDMERQDVDGVAELQKTLSDLDQDARTEIIDGIAPILTELMNKPVEGQSDDPNAGPPPRQIRAKDAAFLLISLAGPESRKALTDGVVDWYTADFNGRNLSGNYSAEQVVRALGSVAAERLVAALNAQLPQQALNKLCELIGQLGSESTKKAAGDKMVQIEQEMESPKYLAWLQGQINEQLKGSGQTPDPPKVLKMASINRDKFIEAGALPAMKHLADQPAVAARLLAVASVDDPRLASRRTRALQALEGKARKEHLDQLLGLALNPKVPVSVRDYAFDRVGDVRDKRAIEPMWPLVQDADDQRLRWRAGELILTLGGASILAEFFSKLPDGAEYEPEELEGYALRMGQMTPLPRAQVVAKLRSPNWWDRSIALMFFQRRGTAADIPAMERLKGDSAAVKGQRWDEGSTVGKVAEQAINGLRERLKQTSGTKQAAG